MLVFNIFLVKTATATRDSCYRLDVEKNSPEQKLECAWPGTQNVILSPSFLRGSASSTPVFAEMGKTVKSSH
jgi:hypothetical protein